MSDQKSPTENKSQRYYEIILSDSSVASIQKLNNELKPYLGEDFNFSDTLLLLIRYYLNEDTSFPVSLDYSLEKKEFMPIINEVLRSAIFKEDLT